jgi:predicted RNase H-like HicB family nuclease
MQMAEYHINVFWSDEDSQWIAEIPDLKGCSASVDSPEEAVREVQIAKELWISVAKEHGDAIPEPQYRPHISAGSSD